MSGMNKIVIVGRLGRDPETRQSAGGNPWSKLSVATDSRRKNRDGSWEDHTEWHKVRVFGAQAETVQKYCRKGQMIGVEGSVHYESWTNDKGEKQYMTTVLANRVTFLERARTEGPFPQAPAASGEQAEEAIPF